MDYTLLSCREFTGQLASKAPVPGGGGAAALVGAVGTALCEMVCALTTGKKKYQAVEPEIREIADRCERIRGALLDQIEADARNFEPLAKAYSIPKDDPNRQSALNQASYNACHAPMEMLRLIAVATECVASAAEKGSRLAVSDAGCAAACCEAAARSAALNIYINTKILSDRETAESLNRQADEYLAQCTGRAEAVYSSVRDSLK